MTDAKRQPHVLGVTAPSRWDMAHGRIDAVLDELDETPAV